MSHLIFAVCSHYPVLLAFTALHGYTKDEIMSNTIK